MEGRHHVAAKGGGRAEGGATGRLRALEVVAVAADAIVATDGNGLGFLQHLFVQEELKLPGA